MTRFEQKLSAVLDATPFPVAVVDLQDDSIFFWSSSALSLFGHTAPTASEWYQIAYPDPDYRREVVDRWKLSLEIARHQSPRAVNTGEYRITCRDGSERICELYAAFIADYLIVTFSDITERKQAEHTARESERRFRSVANTAPVMIWMSGPDKLCNYFNQPWLDFTGRPLETELGNGWAEGVHPEDLEMCLKTYTKAFDWREAFQMEYRLRRHDGEFRWILDQGVPRFNADGSFAGYIGSCVDITERKLAEEVLSTFSQRLIDAQEEERSRIARELHDDISQRLAMLALTLDGLKHDLPASAAELRRKVGKARKKVKDLGTTIRALSHGLHSFSLEHFGLVAAARGFCKELSERQGVEIECHFENIPTDLPKEISLCLFRVLQEALQNATKHSGSRHLRVSLMGGASEIKLIVHDSGIGFEPEEAIKGHGHGLGLISMKERLKVVRGELLIDSRLQDGTTIHARVPLNPKMKSAGA
ncbi:MAG: PAS domain S-box protein [Acidobacteriia bacterium]|nr:PAS domain S-box protein [Terriglobia bacterium]